MATKVATKSAAKQPAAPKKPLEEMFIWEGKNKQGKIEKGELTGTSEALVKAVLRRKGINPTKVKKRPKPLFGGGGKPITAMDIALFARQMTTMMESGVPLLQAFEIIGQGHENRNMQNLILDIKSNVEAGGTFADALRKHPDQFDALFCNLIEAGEQAGILESLLNKVATYKEKSESIKKKIKSALSYPITIVIAAAIVSTILLIYVVPVFADLFKGFGADLPALTAAIVRLSNWLVANWYIAFGSVAAFVFAFKQANKRSQTFNELMQRLLLKLPIFGPLIKLSCIARFARTLSTMFAAGTPLVDAMVSVAGATGNIVYSEAVMKMREDVSTGTALATSMRSCGNVWPNMVVQMVQIGEEGGSVDKMLSKVADYYEEEVDAMVEKISAMMEPLIMAFLGAVIGTLVVAMYLPIFKMGAIM